jgi:murein DD-endopeptidase MepM/ murein hydrolase activator NlpD
MKSLKTYFFIGLLFSVHFSAYGQFNTIIPVLPKKGEDPPVAKNSGENNDLKRKTGKKFRKDTFNTASTEGLKKELDSLKRLIKENSENNNKKWSIQKVKDSLFLMLQSQRIINAQQRNTALTRNDFENQTEAIQLSKIAMPLSKVVSVTSPYGMRIHPLLGTARMHNGIDVKAYYENVYAVMDGTVTAAGWDENGGGNYIKVKHYNRFETAYLHLSEIYYKVGEVVKAGFIIAKSGSTGNSTRPHLHFAVRENGKYINPLHFLNDLIITDRLLMASYQYERNSHLKK